jgi:hypothetical protein
MSKREHISRENYEEYFLDYLDGNLTEDEIRSMEEFLMVNPGLRTELEGLENIVIHPGNETIRDKENLKYPDLTAPVTHNNFAFYCIAENEGDLSEDQLQELYKYLRANPDRQKERLRYAHLNLKPEKGIVYPDTLSLKKGLFVRYRRELVTGFSIAASIALLLVFFFTFIERDINPVAFNEEGAEKEVTETGEAKKQTSTGTEQESTEQSESAQTKKSFAEEEDPRPLKPIRKVSNQISIKVGIPIASNDINREIPQVDADELLASVTIDPSAFRNYFAGEEPREEMPRLVNSYKYIPQPDIVDEERFLTLDEFAKKQFSSVVLREEEEKELNAWTLANAGVKQINSLAGTNLKLEKSIDEEGNVRRITFESRLLSFSTPVNGE